MCSFIVSDLVIVFEKETTEQSNTLGSPNATLIFLLSGVSSGMFGDPILHPEYFRENPGSGFSEISFI